MTVYSMPQVAYIAFFVSSVVRLVILLLLYAPGPVIPNSVCVHSKVKVGLCCIQKERHLNVMNCIIYLVVALLICYF